MKFRLDRDWKLWPQAVHLLARDFLFFLSLIYSKIFTMGMHYICSDMYSLKYNFSHWDSQRIGLGLLLCGRVPAVLSNFRRMEKGKLL